MNLSYRLQQRRIPIWLIKIVIVLAIIGYSLLLGALAGSGRMLFAFLLLGLPLGALACAFVSRYFRTAVLLLPITALAIPISIPTGTYTVLPISLLIVILLSFIWLASMFIREWKIKPSPLNRPMISFCLVCIISLVWGIIWRDPILIDVPRFIIVQLGALSAIVMSISSALLIGNFVSSVAHLKYFLGTFILFCSLMTITQIFHIQQNFLNDQGLWGLWMIAPVYGILICQRGLRWYIRLLLVLGIILNLYQTMIVNADWLSGWVPNIVAIFAITFFRSRKAFFVMLIIGIVIVLSARSFFDKVANDNIDDGSLERITLWEQNWRVVSAHWLFGTGPAGYALYYMTYYKEDARSTHNNYLDILAQFGFSGMIVWLWLAVASIREGWNLIKLAPPGFLRTLAIISTGGWIGAMASMMFGDWVLPFAYNATVSGFKFTVYSWLFLGTLISIRHLLGISHTAEVHVIGS